MKSRKTVTTLIAVALIAGVGYAAYSWWSSQTGQVQPTQKMSDAEIRQVYGSAPKAPPPTGKQSPANTVSGSDTKPESKSASGQP